MDDVKKTAMIVGVGPGLGYSLAEVFGKAGFRTVLTARSEARLAEYAARLSDARIEAISCPADVSDGKSLEAAYARAADRYGAPDVLIYNVGITTLDKDTHIDADVLAARYAVDALGAYRCIRMTEERKAPGKAASVLVTGGGLALHPSGDFLPLSMDKAALRAMVYALHPALKEEGIFLGLVTVMGGIKRGTRFAPEKIAESFLELYRTQSTCEIVFDGEAK